MRPNFSTSRSKVSFTFCGKFNWAAFSRSFLTSSFCDSPNSLWILFICC
ncbi:hypothetical protein EVA_03437 [gut metagenome]|uniref:Uncharacterized protein n=1 Tax=gut metagenome TaxID=749906 RepID=J9D6R6_9ZZZZ